ncbi:peptidase inhibitor family I36 protein [Actinomadura sp. ATCC 31491]|uniref:Peptidase inhibitor family I36 protein n=1 Tax=Actinomadura luzonensis TaxID=2805427 RepID=A0ABT0G6M4_9ACTN|nr:peptidase inhibitor family I36 protein [Actinomadura luzonensis]MCK2220240.1 peptidase inhibitor family I36 protein [Actinomadura luzonensis]
MKFRSGTAVGAAVLGIAGLLVAASPADAQARAARWLLVYEHDDFKGRSAQLSANDSNFINNYWPGSGASINDNISSFRNQGDQRAVMYSDANYTGAAYSALAHSVDSDLTHNSHNPSNFDNVASSVRFVI